MLHKYIDVFITGRHYNIYLHNFYLQNNNIDALKKKNLCHKNHVFTEMFIGVYTLIKVYMCINNNNNNNNNCQNYL